MYSNNIVNFQESTTISNACTKKSGNLLKVPRIYMWRNKMIRKEKGLSLYYQLSRRINEQNQILYLNYLEKRQTGQKGACCRFGQLRTIRNAITFLISSGVVNNPTKHFTIKCFLEITKKKCLKVMAQDKQYSTHCYGFRGTIKKSIDK